VHYLVTGHTGFKGAWLALLLLERGHTVSGLSLEPLEGSLFEAADVSGALKFDFRVDIRDAEATRSAIQAASPDVVMHLAAQPLVRESYRDPRGTYETNVMGTFNVLEAVSLTPSVRATLIVTTDKVYRNINQTAGYLESDPLGGFDPYSSSKAMADLLTQSWVSSFPGVPTAVARAGNVIGGGDVSKDRLLVDLIAAYSRNESPVIRFPAAVRPWQHVLDCVNGYLLLVDALLAGGGGGEWNFGPGEESFVPVANVASAAADFWGDGASWKQDSSINPHEAELLALDSSKAQSSLGWENMLPYPHSLEWTVEWYKLHHSGSDVKEITFDQLRKFENLS
jgi:CDP-glucose 4,6-dehydratase